MTIVNKLKLVTHNGAFHADDIFACAVISLVLEKEGKEFEVIRTRESEIVAGGDYVFDVGGIYDADKNRFDHHQIGGAGNRVIGTTEKKIAIEYASFGLVWKHFGLVLAPSQQVVDFVDARLVGAIDAGDNGMALYENIYEVSPYMIQSFFGSMHPTWKEGIEQTDNMFLKCVDIAKIVLEREIIRATDSLQAEGKVLEAYNTATDKKIILLDKNYPYEYALMNFPEPLFVIYPKEADHTWGVKAVRAGLKSFENKKNFPDAWAGLRDGDLQKVTGVEDAVFCHRALFLAVAKTKEGAIKLAQIALVS